MKAPEFDQKYFDQLKSKVGKELVDALDTAKRRNMSEIVALLDTH